MARTFQQQMIFQAWRTNDIMRLIRNQRKERAAVKSMSDKLLRFHIIDTTRSAA